MFYYGWWYRGAKWLLKNNLKSLKSCLNFEYCWNPRLRIRIYRRGIYICGPLTGSTRGCKNIDILQHSSAALPPDESKRNYFFLSLFLTLICSSSTAEKINLFWAACCSSTFTNVTVGSTQSMILFTRHTSDSFVIYTVMGAAQVIIIASIT